MIGWKNQSVRVRARVCVYVNPEGKNEKNGR